MNRKQRKRRLKELNEQQKKVRDERNETKEKDPSHDHTGFLPPYSQGGIVLPPSNGGSRGLFQFENLFLENGEGILSNVKKIGAEFNHIAAQMDLTKEQYEKFKQLMRVDNDDEPPAPGLPRMK